MIHFGDTWCNDHQNTFKSTPEGEFMNYTVMSWWYKPLQLVSREAKHIQNQFNSDNHQVMAQTDPGLEIPGHDHKNTFKSMPEGEFMIYTVLAWRY